MMALITSFCQRYMPANGTGQLLAGRADRALVGCNHDGYYRPGLEAACNRAFYERHIFPKLRPGQRTAVVPGLQPLARLPFCCPSPPLSL